MNCQRAKVSRLLICRHRNFGCTLVPQIGHNVSICVRAGLPKPRPVPDNERIKDTKTLDNASTPLDANTLLWAGRFTVNPFLFHQSKDALCVCKKVVVNCRLCQSSFCSERCHLIVSCKVFGLRNSLLV